MMNMVVMMLDTLTVGANLDHSPKTCNVPKNEKCEFSLLVFMAIWIQRVHTGRFSKKWFTQFFFEISVVMLFFFLF